MTRFTLILGITGFIVGCIVIAIALSITDTTTVFGYNASELFRIYAPIICLPSLGLMAIEGAKGIGLGIGYLVIALCNAVLYGIVGKGIDVVFGKNSIQKNSS